MIQLKGGQFRMGSDRRYDEEAPQRTVTVVGFWIDPAPVTKRQFAEFVEATDYDARRNRSDP
jgi:sulfatase modifying factor 1